MIQYSVMAHVGKESKKKMERVDIRITGASQIAQLVKSPPEMQGTQVLIPGSGRSTGEWIG